ncbi:MAG: hypothetical protein ACLR23_18335 [Clostridia bacterium]
MFCARRQRQHFKVAHIEKYYRRYGEYFDSLIHAYVTDEPYIQNANTSCGEEVKLPFSYWFAHQFQKKRGYSIIENLPALYGDVEYAGFSFPPSKVRYDYYETLHELWKENYLLPIYTWCKEHHLPLTGHYFEHNWPLANAGAVSPDVMSAYEFMDWPGIDILFSHNLKDSPIHPLQIALWEVKRRKSTRQKGSCVKSTVQADGIQHSLIYKGLRIGFSQAVSIFFAITFAMALFQVRENGTIPNRLIGDSHGGMSLAN